MKEKQLVYDYFINNVPVIFIRCDEEGVIDRVNSFTERLFASDLSGKSLFEKVSSIRDSVHLKELSGRNKPLLFNFNSHFNVPVTYYIDVIKDESAYYIFGKTDSDEIEKLQKYMVQKNNQLNEMTRKLKKKNITLKKLNNQKNQFLGMAAHDLRNPLGIIQTYTEFLLEGIEEKEMADNCLNTIHNLSKFMFGIINDYLQFSSLENGEIRLDCEKFDLNDALRNQVNLNLNLAREKGVNIVFQSENDSIIIEADRLKMMQIINNLLTNAVKFSYENGIIYVRSERKDGVAEFSVRDEGIGIPEKFREKLFKPFSGKSRPGTKGEQGTGLGLAIVFNIVVAHNGDIEVISEEDKGSEFVISIPQRPEEKKERDVRI